MGFDLGPGGAVTIGGTTFVVAEHPRAPGMPYGQEGRAATVYQLRAEGSDEKRALKVFKPRFQVPSLVSLSRQLESFAHLPGLQVCRRTVLTSRREPSLLAEHPDLLYAVLMPWIEGPTWMEVLLRKREVTPEQSLALARSLADILSTLEEERLAHCDLSGPNVLLPALAAGGPKGLGSHTAIALVDVEQMYGPGLHQPDLIPSGSPGYAHRSPSSDLWSASADRFAGAILLAEMLGWCDPQARDAAWGESYFAPGEVQTKSERYQVLVDALRMHWGTPVAQLLERAWASDSLSDCATFGAWLLSFPSEVPVVYDTIKGQTAESIRPDARVTTQVGAGEQPHSDKLPAESTDLSKPTDETYASVRTLLKLGQAFETKGDLSSAVDTYTEALSLLPVEGGLRQEVAAILAKVEVKRDAAEQNVEGNGDSDSDGQHLVAQLGPETAALDEAGLATSEARGPRNEQNFLGYWFVASAVGWMLCVLPLPVGLSGDSPVSVSRLLGFVIGVVLLAILQWLPLRSFFHMTGWWILGSVAAWVCGIGAAIGTFSLLKTIDPNFDSLDNGLYRVTQYTIPAQIGLFVGLTHWWYLRRHISRGGIFALLTMVAYGTAGGIWLFWLITFPPYSGESLIQSILAALFLTPLWLATALFAGLTALGFWLTAQRSRPVGIVWRLLTFSVVAVLVSRLIWTFVPFLVPPSEMLAVLLCGALVGLLLGLGQWIVLRRQISLSKWWMLATTLGFVVGVGIGTGVSIFIPQRNFHTMYYYDSNSIIYLGAATGAAVGLFVAIGQRLVLRKLNLSTRRWMVLLSVGGLLGWASASWLATGWSLYYSGDFLGRREEFSLLTYSSFYFLSYFRDGGDILLVNQIFGESILMGLGFSLFTGLLIRRVRRE